MSDHDLKRRCQKLAQALDQFLDERNRGAPRAAITTSPWQNAHFERLRYMAETGQRYHLEFHPDVLQVYEALRLRGHPVSQLESLLTRPSTQGTIRDIVTRLGALAECINS